MAVAAAAGAEVELSIWIKGLGVWAPVILRNIRGTQEGIRILTTFWLQLANLACMFRTQSSGLKASDVGC